MYYETIILDTWTLNSPYLYIVLLKERVCPFSVKVKRTELYCVI